MAYIRYKDQLLPISYLDDTQKAELKASIAKKYFLDRLNEFNQSLNRNSEASEGDWLGNL